LTLPSTNLKKSQSQTVLRQDTIAESATLDKMVAAYLNYHEVRKLVYIAKTIMARDYKGFSSGFDSTNGVIEWT
jgi:hypothetical protein